MSSCVPVNWKSPNLLFFVIREKFFGSVDDVADDDGFVDNNTTLIAFVTNFTSNLKVKLVKGPNKHFKESLALCLLLLL